VTDTSWLGPPIDVRPLLAKHQAQFLSLLRGLTTDDWAHSTVCPGWSVHDIALHVLGDNLGRLSMYRDGFDPLQPREDEEFAEFLHRINGEWVDAARRLSPRLLIDLLATTGEQIVDMWHSVDMNALGWTVSWSGPEPAPVWLDAARDFSEYWVHHAQIAESIGRTALTRPEYLAPVLDTFMRALPHTLRTVDAPKETAVRVTVTGPAGRTWICGRTATRWAIHAGERATEASVVLDADTAWRLCTRGITPEQAAMHAQTEGDTALTTAVLGIVSIVY
jgi:uncharacterized protein (TIGR03083 family)